MTISMKSDLSDVYCPSVAKPLIEKVLTELHGNSVFTRILDEMLPNGFDVTKFGRISQSKMRSSSWAKVADSVDGLYRIGRLLPTDDKITVNLNIHREYMYRSGYNFTNKFSLRLKFTDEALWLQPMIKTGLHSLNFSTRLYAYDTTRDFEGFVLTQLVDDFNNNSANVLAAFEQHKKTIKAIHAATARF